MNATAPPPVCIEALPAPGDVDRATIKNCCAFEPASDYAKEIPPPSINKNGMAFCGDKSINEALGFKAEFSKKCACGNESKPGL
jgi:hypothetical protein